MLYLGTNRAKYVVTGTAKNMELVIPPHAFMPVHNIPRLRHNVFPTENGKWCYALADEIFDDDHLDVYNITLTAVNDIPIPTKQFVGSSHSKFYIRPHVPIEDFYLQLDTCI